jgi:hypothetical protein
MKVRGGERGEEKKIKKKEIKREKEKEMIFTFVGGGYLHLSTV